MMMSRCVKRLWSRCRKCTFAEADNIVHKGYIGQLSLEDLQHFYSQSFSLGQECELLCNKLASGVRLRSILFGRVRNRMLMAGLYRFLYVTCQVASPIILQYLLQNIEGFAGNRSTSGLVLAISLSFTQLAGNVANQQHLHLSFSSGIRLRAILVTAIFRKTLEFRLADMRARKESVGEMINLISSDSQKVYELFPTVHIIWSAPLQIFLSVFFLYQLLGASSFIGVLTLTLMVPLNKCILSLTEKLRARKLPMVDSRVRLTTEVLTNIRVLKFFRWEKRFLQLLAKKRGLEMRYVRGELHFFAIFIACLISFPVLSLVVTFTAFTFLSDTPLTAPVAFSAMALFNGLRFPLMEMGRVMTALGQARVSTKRIEDYLNSAMDRRKSSNPGLKVGEPDNEDALFNLCGMSYAWCAQSSFILKNVDFMLKSGELVAVVGSVGSGKSLLVQSLLGETHVYDSNSVESGESRNNVTYCPQKAWILNSSVRANILLSVFSSEESGANMDERIYGAVLDACDLNKDLADFEDSDLTIIGERGITLSGGQKARIGMARAAYAALKTPQRSAVLLDDPLSALDAETSSLVWQKLLAPGGLLDKAGVARVLVTHATYNLSCMDRIYVVHSCAENVGEVLCIQNFESVDYFLQSNRGKISDSTYSIVSSISNGTTRPNVVRDSNEVPTDKGELGSEDLKTYVVSELMTEEEKGVGTVGCSVVTGYISSIGFGWIFPLFLAFFFERSSYVLTDFWVALWSDASSGTSPENVFEIDIRGVKGNADTLWYLSVYAIMASLSLVFVLIRLNLFAWMTGKAAGVIFNKLVIRILRAPVVFFETTPLGRITNRFSFDTEMIDSNLFRRINGVVASTSWLIGGIGAIAGSNAWMTPVLLIVIVLYACLYNRYRRACVDLQRLDATTRSPIQSSFLEAISGLDSIRAFRAGDQFYSLNEKLVVDNSQVLFTLNVCNRWLAVRLESLGMIVVLGASTLAWFLSDIMGSAKAGFCILWALQFVISLNFNTVNLTEAESKLTSVERVLHYANKTPVERDTKQIVPPSSWPSAGEVIFDDVVLRYRDSLPPALKGLTVTFPPSKRIGIVGRTGAGKSTISTALFRLRDLESGKIILDGIDISQISLDDLRGRACGISIITQNPVVFSGTMRSALDPFGEYEDRVIKEALQTAQLGRFANDLSMEIKEGGDNFSVGQTQLLCFARALLTKPRVLVMDESTASCDRHTDQTIQRLVRQRFEGCTLLIIAHRLDTIMDADRILVMGNGRALEYGTPLELIQRNNGALSELINSTGADAEKLRKMAMRT